jgi:hypothetical protein
MGVFSSFGGFAKASWSIAILEDIDSTSILGFRNDLWSRSGVWAMHSAAVSPDLKDGRSVQGSTVISIVAAGCTCFTSACCHLLPLSVKCLSQDQHL